MSKRKMFDRRISIRITADMGRQIDLLCAQTNVKESDICRYIIKYFLEQKRQRNEAVQ